MLLSAAATTNCIVFVRQRRRQRSKVRDDDLMVAGGRGDLSYVSEVSEQSRTFQVLSLENDLV
jgi:hypothetical protein